MTNQHKTGPGRDNCWPCIKLNVMTVMRLASYGLGCENPWREQDLAALVASCQERMASLEDPLPRVEPDWSRSPARTRTPPSQPGVVR